MKDFKKFFEHTEGRIEAIKEEIEQKKKEIENNKEWLKNAKLMDDKEEVSRYRKLIEYNKKTIIENEAIISFWIRSKIKFEN